MTTVEATTLARTICTAILDAPLARASYQAALLAGGEAWSGSTLRGKASKYGMHYARSRRALLDRINARMPGGWAFVTRLDSTRHGQRRARLVGPGVDLDWLDLSEGSLAEAILTHAWAQEARCGLRVESPTGRWTSAEADEPLAARGLEFEPCGMISETTTGAERFRGLEL